MLTAKTSNREGPDDEGGFTLIEIAVVVLIFSVVLIMAANSLFSLNNTANRNEAMVTEEQAASGAIAQLSRDIRSANSLTFPTGVAPADEIELAVNNASGGTSNVLWIYTPTAGTLARQVATGNSFSNSGTPVSHVVNPSTVSVFSFYDDSGASISGTTASNISACSTAIQVTLYVGSNITGAATVQQTAEVALTNRLNVLTAPGNGQCVTS